MLRPWKWLSRARGRQRDRVKVNYHASSRGYVAWWIGLLFLHCINVGYYVGVAKLYTSFETSYTIAVMRLLSIGIPESEHAKISVIHATIAAIHAAFILLMVGSSLHARKLVFQPDLRPLFRVMASSPRLARLVSRFIGSQPRTSVVSAGSVVVTETSDRLSSARNHSRRLSDSIGRTGSIIFARDGLLGVDSVYFDHILLVRELVETALQSYQVYRMSQLLPRLWLIRFYVALLVANCWAVPILHRYYRDRETTRRMLCLLCDAVLDMVSSIGISLIIFGTYVPQYTDPHGMGFPFPNWFDDHWLANMQQEFQMMLVVSWGDMVSRLVFALGLLQCMDAIKEMLSPPIIVIPAIMVAHHDKKVSDASPVVPLSTILEPVTSISTPGNTTSVCDEVKAENEPEAASADDTKRDNDVVMMRSPSVVGPNLAGEEAVKPKALSKGRNATSRWQRALHVVVHVIGPIAFVAWGCAILIIHLVAETHHSDSTCELKLKPWFSSKPGCSIIEVNCHALQSTGQDQLILDAMETFDPERAARLVFRHCPQLMLTSKIQEFRNMAGLKIYNSTVVSWGEEAAITATHHPNMRSLFIVRTNFPSGEFPPGLLSNDFPPKVKDMITCVALEFSEFTELPAVVLRLKPSLISLAGTNTSSLPTAAFETPSLGALILGSTQIQELPRAVAQPSPTLGVFFLQNTNITTFWSWMDPFFERQALSSHKLFNAYNTPYCRELLEIVARNRTSFSVSPASDLGKIMDVSTPEKLAFAQRVVDCRPGFSSHFPLPLEDAMHALR